MGRAPIYRAIYRLAPAFEAAVRRGIGPEELAKALGCSRSYLYRLQKGTRQPSRVMAERLAGVARMDVQDLIAEIRRPGDNGEETAQEPLGRAIYGSVR